MGPLGLVAKRARAGFGLLLTILLLSAATTAIIAGTLGYSQAAATVAARQALTDAVPTEAGIQVQTRVADDAAAQDAEARRVIDAAFAPAPVVIQQTTVSEPRPVSDQDGRVVAWASDSLTPQDPRFGEWVEVVAGEWPGSAPEGTVAGALHAGGAERWDLQVGDTFEVGETTVTVVALWRPVNPQDALWFGDPLVAAGGAGTEVGPLLVETATVPALGGVPFTRWTVQPDATDIRPSDMAVLADAAARLVRDLRGSEVDVRGVTVEGDLAPTSATAARNLATAQALNVVPVVLLLLVSLIAVVQIARLQSAARTGEVELLIARGSSRVQIFRWTLLESVAVAVLAVLLGVGLALGAMRLVPAGELQDGTVIRAGLFAGLAMLAALVTITVLQVRALAARGATDRSGRTRQVAALGTLVLTLGAAGLSWWQLRQYGSPLVVADDGSLETDLLAGAAPALLLAAVAVVAMALLGPLGRLAEALTRPARGLTGHLSASQVSRRLVVYAVPVVLTVLAVGTTTVSSMYAATSASLRASLADLGQGAPIRAELAPSPATRAGTGFPDVTDIEGVDVAIPVWTTDSRLGESDLVLTALPTALLGDVALLPPGSMDPAEATALAADDPGVGLDFSAGARELSLDLTVDTSLTPEILEGLEQSVAFLYGDDAPDLSEEEIDVHLAWLDGFDRPHQLQVDLLLASTQVGVMTQVEAGAVDFDTHVERDGQEFRSEPRTSRARLTVELPDGHQLDRVVGVLLRPAQIGPNYHVTIDIEAIGAGDGDNLLLVEELPWDEVSHLTGAGGFAELEPVFTRDPDTGVLRLEVQTGGWGGHQGADVHNVEFVLSTPPTGTPAVPALVTTSLATTNNLEMGSPMTLRGWGRTIQAEVAGIVPALPGTLSPAAVLIDSSALAATLISARATLPDPRELWIATDDPQVVLERVAAVEGIVSVSGPGAVTVTDAAAAVRLVFWVAATGAVLLAVTGVGAVAATLLRVRRSEVAVLRALGMTPGAQARSRAAELWGVTAAALLLGAGAGWLVGALVIPDLARSTTLAEQVAFSPQVTLELPLWAGLIGLLVATLLALTLLLAGRVRTQALDNEFREEIR